METFQKLPGLLKKSYFVHRYKKSTAFLRKSKLYLVKMNYVGHGQSATINRQVFFSYSTQCSIMWISWRSLWFIFYQKVENTNDKVKWLILLWIKNYETEFKRVYIKGRRKQGKLGMCKTSRIRDHTRAVCYLEGDWQKWRAMSSPSASTKYPRDIWWVTERYIYLFFKFSDVFMSEMKF